MVRTVACQPSPGWQKNQLASLWVRGDPVGFGDGRRGVGGGVAREDQVGFDGAQKGAPMPSCSGY
ncbi:hypothetical protein ACFYOF_18070 [Streptomyces sp. NPDC007148]|uniref:hypothetical protein n=1 Tax=Streptomyces sp. NPDC007148 TaxID=3364775 RepID=UPI0036C2D519